jgi:glycosyltransferase involved in cell wall biosynthesis
LWLTELEVAKYVKKHATDVVHVMYAEEYYRFLGRLLPHTPIVATFHQPDDILLQEITKGDYMGRVAGLAHRLNRDRFARLSAAIVMTPNQKAVLATAMPADKIHVLPLGVDVSGLSARFEARTTVRDPNLILTVGNWQRDWEFYFQLVAHCATHHPDWRFVLVNKRLPEEYAAQAAGLHNLSFRTNVPDEELYALYLQAAVQFLPFLGAAGNNSLNESLALGCPVVTNISAEIAAGGEKVVTLYASGSVPAAADACLRHTLLSPAEREALAIEANILSKTRDWNVIAQRTLSIYQSVI